MKTNISRTLIGDLTVGEFVKLLRKIIRQALQDALHDAITDIIQANLLRDHADMAHKLDNIIAFASSCDTATKSLLEKQDTALASLGSLHKKTDRIDNRDKRYKRKTKLPFDMSKLDDIYDLWKIGKNNPEIKCGINTRLSYEAVFNFYRRQFVALGVTSAEVLKRAVRIKDRQLRNTAEKKK